MILYEKDYERYGTRCHRILELEIYDKQFFLKICWRYKSYEKVSQIWMTKEEFNGILELMYQALIEEMKKE